MKTAKILYHNPDKSVRALSPKVLIWDDHKKERHYFEPDFVNGKVVYTVAEEYARILLGGQPERYFLLEPKKLHVKVRSRDGLSHSMKEVVSIMGSKKFKDVDEEAAKEAAERKRVETGEAEPVAAPAAKGAQAPATDNKALQPSTAPAGAPPKADGVL